MISLKELQITKVRTNPEIVSITWDTASPLGYLEKVKTGNFSILPLFTGEFKDRIKITGTFLSYLAIILLEIDPSIFLSFSGNAYEAIECSKRAFHYSPGKYKDIPLLNMANVLHKHGYTKNATSLLKKALKYRNDKSAAIHHFTLGNFFATMEGSVLE